MMNASAPVSGALVEARMRLQDAENNVARANAGHAGRSTDAAMASAAQAAVFQEALLATIHARLAELKAVAKP